MGNIQHNHIILQTIQLNYEGNNVLLLLCAIMVIFDLIITFSGDVSSFMLRVSKYIQDMHTTCIANPKVGL